MAELSRARAQRSGISLQEYTYRPRRAARHPGGDLDDRGTLDKVLPFAAVRNECMLLALGGSVGSLRIGLNMLLAFRAQGLFNMLIMSPEEGTCESLWKVVPTVACVWWPSIFRRARPPSLYNTRFDRNTLVFYEARKLLLARLVIEQKLNVLREQQRSVPKLCI